MNMEDLLSNWGFSSYAEKFKENKIDITVLKLLTFETLADLILPVGDRLKFLQNVKNLISCETENNVQFEQLSNLQQGVTIEIENGKESSNVNPEQNSNPILEQVDVEVVPEIEFSALPNDVRKYLDCVSGRRVVSNYFGHSGPGKEPFLDEQHQNILVDLIIKGELQDATTAISTSRFKHLAANVVEIFPNENKCIYFIPYSSVRINNKVIKKNPAQGKLWWKYSNTCKVLRKDGLRIRKRLRVSEEDTTSTSVPETISGVLLWLEGQLKITDNLKAKWKETAQHRLNVLLNEKIQCNTIIKRSGKCLINNYFLKYPFLRQQGGYNLLELDFLAKYPQCENKLFSKWPAFKETVIRLSGETNRTVWSDAAILSSLCDIVVKEQKNKRICSKWVANSEEIKEGFLLHIKNIDCYHAEIERITKRALEKKLHVSPFAIVVGPDVHHIADAYIHVDGVQFRVASPLHAIDLTFKVVHALHAVYQAQSISIWLLVQRVLYELTTEWDPVCPVVEKLFPKFA